MQSKLECAFDFLYKKCNEETARELYVKRRPINALRHGAYEWECQRLYEYWKRGSATTMSNSLVLLVTSLVVSKLLTYIHVAV
ncbi:hypothetical protein DdX_02544 [Ditylenchus destructor]|uniref:Uncharacterized protein n=1 Tax=Ditylenchus destructor TaxID=166010 RepID=A0AAD4NHK1_9BILA|nr:hypothetical protein DdX_02544 [Ditylenchus destructor]